MKIKRMPKLLFPIVLILGMIGFTNVAFAKNCTITSPNITANLDLMVPTPAVISIPTIVWTCQLDQVMNAANSNFCYRLDPTAPQSRDNNSFYLTTAADPTARLGFQLRGDDNGNLSKNDNSLDTEGFSWGPISGAIGSPFQRDAGAYRMIFYSYGSQDRVVAGTYTGTYNFWIYQQDNYVGNTIMNCANVPPTSRSLAGTIKLTINVLKNCLLESPTNIDFGKMSGIAASTTQPTANGSVAIRCTYKTDYSIGIDAGKNSINGLRQTISSDGRSSIPYQLCQDSSCATPFATSGAAIKSGTGLTVDMAKTTPIYARIPKLTTVPAADVYTDTVIATVTF